MQSPVLGCHETTDAWEHILADASLYICLGEQALQDIAKGKLFANVEPMRQSLNSKGRE